MEYKGILACVFAENRYTPPYEIYGLLLLVAIYLPEQPAARGLQLDSAEL